MIDRARKRLSADLSELTPEQRAAVEARRAERETPEYQASLARELATIREEFPPRAPDAPLAELLTALRLERERRGLSLADVSARTRLNATLLANLENGELASPPIATLQAYAEAVGKRVALSLVD